MEGQAAHPQAFPSLLPGPLACPAASAADVTQSWGSVIATMMLHSGLQALLCVYVLYKASSRRLQLPHHSEL